MDKNEADLDQEFLKLSYDIAKFYEEFINGSKPYLKSEKGKEQLKILKVKKTFKIKCKMLSHSSFKSKNYFLTLK